MNTNGSWRKALTLMNRNLSTAATSLGRVASWIRRDYPRTAPERGHNYLIALCGGLDSYATR